MLNWYSKYRTEISWWVIGWLTFAAIDCLLKTDYVLALVNTVLIVINYKLWKNQ